MAADAGERERAYARPATRWPPSAGACHGRPSRRVTRSTGPHGKVSLADLFEGRRQLIVYRAFFEPGVHGWPEHACIGCSMVADQVSDLAHLNARDTTLVFVSRAPQADIARLKARMGWEHIPWYTHHRQFRRRLRRRPVARPQRVHPRGRSRLPHLLHQQPRRRGDRYGLELPRHDRARPSGGVGGFAGRLSAEPAVQMVELARQLRSRAPRPTSGGSRSPTPARPRSGSARRRDRAGSHDARPEVDQRERGQLAVARGHADLRCHGLPCRRPRTACRI